MNRRTLVVVAHLVALAPVTRWAVLRVTEGAGEPWGLAAAALAVWIALRGAGRGDAEPDLRVPATLLLASAVAGAVAPPLVAAAFGAASLVALASALRGRRLPEPGLLGLALLALPDVSTLQFFVGWPFRVAVGEAALPLLGLLGIHAERQGTMLAAGERLVAVDAPCSGVWMLWGGLVLATALAALRDAGPVRTLALVAAVVPVVFVSNVLRTVSAFLVETVPGRAPEWAHAGVGVVTFAAPAVVLLAAARRLTEGRPCAA